LVYDILLKFEQEPIQNSAITSLGLSFSWLFVEHY